MFKKEEWKRNLLGSLEVALLMPVARTRFGNNAEGAIRSFFIPLLLLPMTLVTVYVFPPPGLPQRPNILLERNQIY